MINSIRPHFLKRGFLKRLTHRVGAAIGSVTPNIFGSTKNSTGVSSLSFDSQALRQQISQRVFKSLGDARDKTESAALAIGNEISMLFDVACSNNEIATESLQGVIGDSELDSISTDDMAILELLERQRESINAFVQNTQQFFTHQIQLARESRVRFDEVQSCVARIERIVNQSKILAINAQIESTKLGTKARAFSAVGEQMKNFSLEIQVANDAIQGSVVGVSKTIDQLDQGAIDMQSNLEEFSSTLTEEVGAVENRAGVLTEAVTGTLEKISSSNELLMAYSRNALSELQFQDPLAQDLQRTEHEIQKLISLLEFGECDDTELAAIDPVVGNDGSVERETGVVELF